LREREALLPETRGLRGGRGRIILAFGVVAAILAALIAAGDISRVLR